MVDGRFGCLSTSSWLQPESYLDYKQCDLVIGADELRCNWPATIMLYTKDQYGKVVTVPNLKVRLHTNLLLP